jgi:hypothetical protein
MATQRITRSPRPAAVSFAAAHVEPFTDNAALLGLPPGLLAAYTGAVQEARDALAQVEAARQAYKAAAALAESRCNALNRVMTRAVETIDLTASTAADPSVLYQAAQLIPPNTPGVMPAPGRCDSFKAALNSDGSVTISWKCRNPDNAHGTIYQVLRRLPGEGTFKQVELTARKRFRDATLPAGAGQAQYTVQGRRGNTLGPLSAAFTVLLGAAQGGADAEAQPLAA